MARCMEHYSESTTIFTFTSVTIATFGPNVAVMHDRSGQIMELKWSKRRRPGVVLVFQLAPNEACTVRS